MEFYAAERKKELLPFATAWMELILYLFSIHGKFTKWMDDYFKINF